MSVSSFISFYYALGLRRSFHRKLHYVVMGKMALTISRVVISCFMPDITLIIWVSARMFLCKFPLVFTLYIHAVDHQRRDPLEHIGLRDDNSNINPNANLS